MHTISNGANSRDAANGRYQAGAGRARLSSHPLVSNALVSCSVSARFEGHRHIVVLIIALFAKNRGACRTFRSFPADLGMQPHKADQADTLPVTSRSNCRGSAAN